MKTLRKPTNRESVRAWQAKYDNTPVRSSWGVKVGFELVIRGGGLGTFVLWVDQVISWCLAVREVGVGCVVLNCSRIGEGIDPLSALARDPNNARL